ncbi:glyoxalase [Actinopolyspora erythraea]|uniref:Glyoxalase n=1 Tax=Actinopolyspora erythraea TaxID=414996 RepID=A0A223RWY1_9ACTN|nr:VOC family protein [Actinopolyspora erythraea]ASU80357.1 glyoxalase [Actinopolyspora erythraea]
MPDKPVSSVWPILHYDDTRAALRFLVDVLGFHEVLAVPDDEGDIVHAELRWPGGGALVFGSTKHTDGVHARMRAGSGAVYVATENVDAVHSRVRRARGDVVVAPHDTEFGSGTGSYAFTVRDPEGNLWTFGTYRGPEAVGCRRPGAQRHPTPASESPPAAACPPPIRGGSDRSTGSFSAQC